MTTIVEGLSPLSLKKKSVVAIGNFDGVHRGHQRIISYAAKKAADMGGVSVIIAFRAPASDILLPKAARPKRIMPFEDVLSRLTSFHPTYIIAVDFSRKLCRMSAQEFFDTVREYYHCAEIVEGVDFRFGNGNEGDTTLLKTLASRSNVNATIFPFLRRRGEKISSTAIRAALMHGNIRKANAMLGAPFAVSGVVEKGKQLGRTIGYPTANIALQENVIIPKDGVYYTRVTIGNRAREYPAMTFIGTPSMQRAKRRIETFVFDRALPMYGKTLTVCFHRFIRTAMPIPSLTALKSILQRDEKTCRAIMQKEKHAWH